MKSTSQFVLLLLFEIFLLTRGFVTNKAAFPIRNPSLLKIRQNDSSPLQTESAELLSLLLKKYNGKVSALETERIEDLIEFLTSQNLSFDPDVSLNGPLYAVLYQKGPQPFWEEYDFDLSQFTGIKNIKGQRYQPLGDGTIGVTNYAEFWGKSFSVQATGVAKKNEEIEQSSKNNEDDTSSQEQTPKSTRSKILGAIFKKKQKAVVRNTRLLTCPVDYTIQVKNAYVNILDNKFDIDINGTGYLRVLYADENMRILTSPKDTTDTKVGEKAGLTVAQVRVDLLDDSTESDE